MRTPPPSASDNWAGWPNREERPIPASRMSGKARTAAAYQAGCVRVPADGKSKRFQASGPESKDESTSAAVPNKRTRTIQPAMLVWSGRLEA